MASIPEKQEQKKRLLKAKIAVALHDELGRVPTVEEIESNSIADICRTLRISRATLYRYIRAKKEP